MATGGSLTQTERRRPAQEDICPLESKSLRTDRDTPVSGDTDVSGDITVASRLSKVWVDSPVDALSSEASEDELGRLDIDLDRTSKQHNLTSSNVRAILHEVITHEHVVAMMKTAIRDTQDLPMFEPKMTRSRLKEAVQQGQPLNWSLSALNSATVKPPQFVDIDLEDDEDSSDEEYCPDEEEEEEDTAEETFLSDADSLASPPRMHQGSQPKPPADQGTEEPLQRSQGHVGKPVMASSGAPHHLFIAPESSFLERLNAVDEELDCSPTYTYSQSLDRKADDDDDDGGDGRDEGSGGLAYRTRSKRPLVNVPLGQLEAELLAPDITADMYEQNAAQREEDRHWTKWLQGLMAPDCEEEGDDDDDPEYNVLEDLDEPDLEDYRTDRAVQITKKEVNELLEELFDTLQEEGEVAAEEQEEEEEEVLSQTGPKFNVPQALRFEAPLASMLTERRRTVRKQYEALQQKRALQDMTNHQHDNVNLKATPSPQPDIVTPVLVLPSRVYSALHLDYTQKLQLQQQIQQHVQLLTQVHLLSRHVDALNHETSITKRYLEELQQFASCREEVFLPSSFRVVNLQGALDLLQEVEQRAEPPPAPPAPSATRRWLPRMTLATNSLAFPLLPADTAWLFATRPVFLYPELLPVCSLDPTIHTRQNRSFYTAGEDGLIVLGLKHFEGTVQSDQLISSYLLCKNRWNFRKHVREMSGSRALHNNAIKMFMTQGVVPPLPLACSRVQPGDQRPPVDRDTPNMPNWLKNSQLIIQKTRLNSNCYPPFLPPGCALRLHPSWLKKSSHPPPRRHRRLFTLAHNASLLPLAKAPEDTQVERQVDMQPIRYLSLPPTGVALLSDPPAVSGVLVPPPAREAIPLADVRMAPAHSVCTDIIQSCLPIGQRMQQRVSRQQSSSPAPRLLPLPAMTHPVTTNPIMPCSADAVKPGYFLLQMVWTPPALPTGSSQHALGQKILQPMKEEFTRRRQEEKRQEQEERQMEERREEEEERKEEERQVAEESSASTSTLSPLSSCEGEEEQEENWTALGMIHLNEGKNTGEEVEDGGDGGGGEEGDGGGEEEEDGGGGEEEDGADGGGGEEEAGGGGDGEQEGGEEEEEEDGEKDKDEDQDRQGDEEEEEEDFDDLTQDEDEEEVMSSASEESVLSVPELQETMKQLTWLAAEQRLCTDGDSEEDHSPTSPGSQEEEEEEEEDDGAKGEESGEGRSSKVRRDEETPSGEGTPRGGGRCPGRGRGQSRPLRGLRRSRQERHSKDAAKLLLLYDENILNNDPHRESKDVAFAQSYLNRVREALQDVPGQVEEFVSLLNDFEQMGEGQEVKLLFRKLRCILGDRTDLLRDFAAFLHPEQALQCGLFEEQQAFERSRRFLRQLEISFGDNQPHYQKIIKALQTGPDLSPTSIHELKAQMATLLKGHTHLQAEFWVFFDELRPPPARPGQFEEAHWPEDGGAGSDGGDGVGHMSGGGASTGFEEVTLPELEEEDEGHKIQPMTGRRRRRKMDYKDCDWSDKDWPCLCRDVKLRRHRRKGCSHCHGNKTPGGVSRAMKSLDPLYSQISSAHDEPGDKDLDLKGDDDSPQPDRSGASWEVSFPLIDEKEEEEEEELDEEEEDDDEEERRSSEKEQSPLVKRSRREEVMGGCSTSSILSTTSPMISSTTSSITSPMISSTTSSITSPMISSTTSSITSPMISSTTSSIISPMISSTTSSITSPMISSTTSTVLSTSPPITSSTTSSITSPMISSFTTSSITSSTTSTILSTSPPITSSTTSSITSPMISSTTSTPITLSIFTSTSVTSSISSSTSPSSSSSAPPPRPSPPPDLPVCAKNISLTASGEKVILWTREADRVILTTCQQDGANQSTFQAVSTLLGNKTPSEVSRRFRDLMRLFRTAARQTGSEDEAPPTEAAAANEQDE